MKYKVHIYAEVRVPIEIDAPNQIKACQIAVEQINLHQLLDQGDLVEYGESISGFLVDEIGDKEHTKSMSYEIEDIFP